MVVGLQQFCRLRVLDDLGDLIPDKTGGSVIGRLVERQVVVDRHEGKAATLPPRFVSGAALIVAIVERAAIRQLGIDAVARLLARKAPDSRIVGPKRLALLGGQGGVASG